MNAGNMARHAASICARGNTCGGVKKTGLAPSVGWFLSSNPNMIRATNTKYGLKCVGKRTVGPNLFIR